jgi:hypothetical protein
METLEAVQKRYASAYAKEYYTLHRQHIIDKSRKWRLDNPVRYAARQKKWRDDNPEKMIEYGRRTKLPAGIPGQMSFDL